MEMHQILENVGKTGRGKNVYFSECTRFDQVIIWKNNMNIRLHFVSSFSQFYTDVAFKNTFLVKQVKSFLCI